MPYLRRRVEKLFDDIRNGRVHFVDSVLDGLEDELLQIRRSDDGEVDLESVSEHVRSFARAYYLATTALEGESESGTASGAQVPPEVGPKQIRSLNTELFDHLAEVFVASTGVLPSEFVTEGKSFATAVRETGAQLAADRRLAERLSVQRAEALQALDDLYRKSGNTRLRAAAEVPGMKVVLGGSQNFSEASLSAVRSMALYSDTILIPDPVFRWFEGPPKGEAFTQVRMLEDIYNLLQLRPLVDADLPFPPVVVFLSWEKTFEEKDETTQDGIELLAIDFFSRAIDASFDDLEEIVGYVRRAPEDFLSAVERQNLFVALGGEIGTPLEAALPKHKEALSFWRDDNFLAQAETISDAELVFLSIIERLGPQFHVTDNADSLGACPLFALDVHWHYFQRCFDMSSRSYEEQGQISEPTIRLVQSLAAERVAWLGSVPMEDLVRLRADLANVDFRRDLHAELAELAASSTGATDSSVTKVCTAIQRLLVRHDVEARRIDDEYRRKHKLSKISLLLSGGASFLPWLPVITPLAIAGAAGKMVVDEAKKRMLLKQHGRTLMGVLAASARSRPAQ